MDLSIINLFTACSRAKCPIVEMFFDGRGCIPQDYCGWLQERFLLCGRMNQSANAIQIAINNKENLNFYVCSRECDFVYLIGNCQNPWKEETCPWCKKIIGGTAHNLTRATEGARSVPRARMEA